MTMYEIHVITIKYYYNTNCLSNMKDLKYQYIASQILRSKICIKLLMMLIIFIIFFIILFILTIITTFLQTFKLLDVLQGVILEVDFGCLWVVL